VSDLPQCRLETTPRSGSGRCASISINGGRQITCFRNVFSRFSGSDDLVNPGMFRLRWREGGKILMSDRHDKMSDGNI